MTACLVPQEIVRYRAGELETAEELLAIEEHLDSCPACRQHLLAEISAAAPALRQRLTSPVAAPACPEPTLLTRYVEGLADATDIELVRTHCESCLRCAQDLAARLAARSPLLATGNMTTQTASMPRWRQRLHALFLPNGLPAHPGSAAFALVLVAALGALTVYRGRVLPLEARYQALVTHQKGIERQARLDLASRAELEKRLQQSTQMHTAQEMRLRDLEARLSQLPRTMPSGDSAQTVAVVEQAMVTRRIEIGPEPRRLLALMPREQSQVRSGSADSSDLTLLQPVGTLILEDRPTLRWKQGAGARNDTVTLRRVPDPEETDPNEEQKGSHLTGTAWKVEKPLRRGKRYRWQVAAPDGIVSVIGEFLVADAQTSDTLRRAAQEYSGQHLTLGILYTKAGLLDAAETELAAIRQTDPQSAIARELLQHLRASRSPTGPNSAP